ncbi:MAG TPA: sugar nucleotide-binding protein [Polyangiaceae bacterium]|nr:sugar nucleotide-binding protein [Polyangiaceae bacterium]
MAILIFGAGFLGNRLKEKLPGAVLSTADVTDRSAVAGELRAHAADAVINCAGKTGKPNVDWCDAHPIETQRANVIGPLVLAEVCAQAGVYLLHLGSGCIFYGASPQPGGWREDDFANPSSFYSRSKYAADLVLGRLPNVGIARLRMPIDSRPGSRNLITKLASYRQVIDVENSVTVVDDLIGVAAALVEKRATGVFHATNPGTMRHRDLLALYRELVDPAHQYTLIDETELVSRGLATHPRSNCILASPRLAALGITMRPIATALRDAMSQYAKFLR